MAASWVANLGSGSSKSSATSIAMTTGATVPVGDVILVGYCGSTSASAVSSITDSAGNTYSVLKEVSGTTSHIALWGSVLGTQLASGSTITVNLAAASGIRDVVAVDFTSLTLTQDVTAVSAAGTSSTPSTGATAATTTADTLTVGLFAVSNGTASGTFTQGTGYTKDQEVSTGTTSTNRSLAMEHRVNSSTGTQTADGTYGTSMAWDALEVVLQASASLVTKSSTETGTGTDATSAETATATSTESGAGTDASSTLTAAATSTETGAGTDTSTALARSTTSTDTGAGADATSALAATTASTDSGAGADATSALGQATVVASTDSGAGVDATLSLVPIVPVVPIDTGGGGWSWERPYLRQPSPPSRAPVRSRPTPRERVLKIRVPTRAEPVRADEPFVPWFLGPLPARARPPLAEVVPAEPAIPPVVRRRDEEEDLLLLLELI